MRWPFTTVETDHRREIEGPSIESRIGVHRSPGLAAALSQLNQDRPCNILDLGPALAQNVEFFSRYRCRLHIVDVLGRLADEPESVARLEYAPELFFADLLPIGSRSFDLILAWGVFDHIEFEAARQLASRLVRLTQAGARLHAVLSINNDVDDIGVVFAICDHDTLDYRAAAGPEHCSPAFKPAAFAQLLEGFTIDRSVVLRHGFQEYVAVRT